MRVRWPFPPARKNSNVSGSTRRWTDVFRAADVSTIAALRQKSSSSSISGASAGVAFVRPLARIFLISSSEDLLISSSAIFSYLPGGNQVPSLFTPCVDDHVKRAVHLAERLNAFFAIIIAGID